FPSAGRIAEEAVGVGGPIKAWVDADEVPAGFNVAADFVGAGAFKDEFNVESGEGGAGEVADGGVAAGGEDEIGGLAELEHAPDGVDVLGRVAPVASGREVAEHQAVLLSGFDPGGRGGDFAGDEVFAAPGRFVVVSDSAANE